MRLSIVTSLYRSAPYIREFHTRMSAVAAHITPDYEIIYVNDGSPDNVVEIAQALFREDTHTSVIDLSRNFGHHKALMTGLAHADGDLIFLIDVDLEEPPELLTQFYTELQNHPDADVVYGQMLTREGNWIRATLGGLYYRILQRLTGMDIPPDLLMTRLMTRRYTRHLVAHREHRYSIEGLWELTGYRQIPVRVEKAYKGETTYTFSKRLALAVNGITALSHKPLVYIAYLGITITFASLVFIAYLLILYFFGGSRIVEGWTTVTASIWLLGGINIFVLGIIGIYLSVVFEEAKPRPYTVIREHLQHDNGRRTPLNPSLSLNPEAEEQPTP